MQSLSLSSFGALWLGCEETGTSLDVVGVLLELDTQLLVLFDVEVDVETESLFDVEVDTEVESLLVVETELECVCSVSDEGGR